MRVITKREQIRNVAALWASCYNHAWETKDWVDKREVYEKLRTLDLDRASEADVAEVIGNKTWTSLACDECRREVQAVIEVAQAPSRYICRGCVKKGMELLSNG